MLDFLLFDGEERRMKTSASSTLDSLVQLSLTGDTRTSWQTSKEGAKPKSQLSLPRKSAEVTIIVAIA